MKNILEVKNLVKSYGDFTAVNNVSFDIKEGEIFGFLGPNGAGKSTTINILSTIIGRTSGDVILNGNDLIKDQDKVRSDIGIVFQDFTSDIELTAKQNLKLHAEFYNIPKGEIDERVDEVLKIVDLLDWKEKKVKNFSGGMKRRLEIGRGLMHYPKILFLDEPTTGLDPQTRANIWKYLLKLKEEKNITLFLTTHYMEEAEICDNICIMDHGEIVASGNPDSLKEDHGFKEVKFKFSKLENLEEILKGEDYNIIDNVISIKVKDASSMVVKIIKKYSGDISKLEINRPTLDDVFLNITGIEIREEN